MVSLGRWSLTRIELHELLSENAPMHLLFGKQFITRNS